MKNTLEKYIGEGFDGVDLKHLVDDMKKALEKWNYVTEVMEQQGYNKEAKPFRKAYKNMRKVYSKFVDDEYDRR